MGTVGQGSLGFVADAPLSHPTRTQLWFLTCLLKQMSEPGQSGKGRRGQGLPRHDLV
jgi:hypothetical protein